MTNLNKRAGSIGLGLITIIILIGMSSCSSEQEPKPKEVDNKVELERDVLAERTQFWDSIVVLCFPGRSWDSTTFNADGKLYADFATSKPLVNAAMISKYSNPATAAQYLPEVIRSGSSFPSQFYLDSASVLYKMVPKGNNIQGPSPYYVTVSELDWVKAHPGGLEQKLGLPLSSVSASYDVFTITSQRDSNMIFQSTIAPTEQFAKKTKDIIYSTLGGATQSLVIDNSDTLSWIKSTVRTDSIVPNCLPKID